MKTFNIDDHYYDFRFCKLTIVISTFKEKWIHLYTKANDGMFIMTGDWNKGQKCSTIYKPIPVRKFQITVYRKGKDLRSELDNFFKRLWYWNDIRKTINEIHDYEKQIGDISSDPMCGCPDDFIEDYSKKLDHLATKLFKYGCIKNFAFESRHFRR